MLPELPEPFAVPTSAVTRGLRCAALGVKATGPPALTMIIQSEDQAAARQFERVLTEARDDLFAQIARLWPEDKRDDLLPFYV